MTMRQGNFTAFFVGMAELCSIFVGLSPVGSVVDLKTGGHWFDPRLGQYSFRGLMIVIMTDSFLSHCCPLFRQWLCWKAASGLDRILCRVLVKRTPGKPLPYN